MRMAASGGGDENWAELDVGADFQVVVEQLATAEIELPEVGIDLPDARGLSSGVEGELVWEAAKVAVVRELAEGEAARVSPEWQVFVLDDCAADVTPLVSALRGKGDQA